MTIEDLQPPGVNLDGVLAFRYEPSRERYTVRPADSGGMTSVEISYEEANPGRMANALLDAVEKMRLGTAYRIPGETSHASQPRLPSTEGRRMRRIKQNR
jgi:hypothetical protein